MVESKLYSALKDFLKDRKKGGVVCPAGEHICFGCNPNGSKKCENEAEKIIKGVNSNRIGYKEAEGRVRRVSRTFGLDFYQLMHLVKEGLSPQE